MKAYRVFDNNDDNVYQDIVFAENHKEAKKLGFSASYCLDDVEWMNIRANREPILDGMEKCKKEEILYVLITELAWWYEIENKKYDEDNIEEAIEKGFVIPYEVKEQSE